MAEKKKTVKIKLFKDYGEYRDDVFVAVNGESYLIQRGVDVEVPDGIAEVLAHTAKQDEKTQQLMAQTQARYEQKTAAL